MAFGRTAAIASSNSRRRREIPLGFRTSWPEATPRSAKAEQSTDRIFPPGIDAFDLDRGRARDLRHRWLLEQTQFWSMTWIQARSSAAGAGMGFPLSEIDNDPTPALRCCPARRRIRSRSRSDPLAHLSKDGLLYVGERGSGPHSGFHQARTAQFVTSFFRASFHASARPGLRRHLGSERSGHAELRLQPGLLARPRAEIRASRRRNQQHGVDSSIARTAPWPGPSAATAATRDNCIGSTPWPSIPKATSILARSKTANEFRNSF